MRRIIKNIACVFIMIIFISAFTACGSEEKGATLTFGTNAEFPPFEFETENGIIDKYDGVDIALAKQIAEENGMTPAIVNMEFEVLLDALQNGEVDAVIAGMSASADRLEDADFSIPYYTATQVMIIKEDSDIFKALDMEDKKICVIKGYTGEDCVSKMGYSYESCQNGADAIAALVNGNCDVVIIDSATAKKYVQENDGLKIVEDPDAFDSEEYAIAVKKGNTELLNMINASIETKLSDGTIAELAVKYSNAAAE